MITVEVVDEALTRELRRRVLRPELGPDDPLPGDELINGVHLAALEDGRALSTAYVYPDPCPWLPGRAAWHLRQMATSPLRRGQGLGGRVLETALDHVRGQGAAVLWCRAREQAVPFYARHGFTQHGAIFMDERAVPHRLMARELSEPSARSTSST
jgi:GNAT superfamily N-acetyltransferase